MAEDDTASEQPKANSPAGAAEDKGEDAAGDAAKDKGIFLPLIFGGAVAAALGFFGSQIDSVERALGLAPPDDNELEQAVDAQAERIAAQSEEIAALTEQVENLPEPPPPADLSGIESRLSDQATRIDELAQRVEEVEKRPMTESVSEDAIAAYEEELRRLQTAVEEQRGEIESLLEEARSTETEAESKAQLALARAAVARVITAVDNGAPFAEELDALRDVSDVQVPQVLTAAAPDGVATLGALQSQFPNVARDALSAARAERVGSGGGFGAFLERQLGARSVTPQQGDDPDAVLSRAEAAVMRGRLDEALAEIEALPDAARAAMGDWTAQAETRLETVRAAQELMAALGTN